MGRWAQAQRRGTSRGPAVSAPTESSFAIAWDGGSADHVRVIAAFGVPPGITHYAWQGSSDEEGPTVLVGDGDGLISALPEATSFVPGDEFQAYIRFAWGVVGGELSSYGPLLPVQV